MVPKPWIFNIPTKLPPPEPPDRVAVPASQIEPPNSIAYAESDELWPILKLILWPPAKPSDPDRRAENEDWMVEWVQSIMMAVTIEEWQRDVGTEWYKYQLEFLPT